MDNPQIRPYHNKVIRRRVVLDDVPTTVKFFIDCFGEGTAAEGEGVAEEFTWFECIDMTLGDGRHIKEKYGKRRRIEWMFVDGKIDEVCLSADVGRWLRTERVISKPESYTLLSPLTLYLKQAAFLEDPLTLDQRCTKEEVFRFINELASVGVGYAEQIQRQLENSANEYDQGICKCLERISAADQVLHIFQRGYRILPESIPQHDTGISFGEMEEKMKHFGVDVKED